MSKKKEIIKQGRIELYSFTSYDYIASKGYWSPKSRRNIINSWKKAYPNKSFYVIIKPEVD